MNKVCLITGGGSGVGRSAALALAAANNQVIVCGRRIDRLEETVRLAHESAGSVLPITADVSVPDDVETLFAKIKSELGRLDVLFNNAGMNIPALPLEEISDDQWQQTVSVNLNGIFYCTRAAIRVMKKQDPIGGRIINNGSISAHVPRPHAAAYTATKHAVTGLTKSTSLEGRNHNIACGQIDIGNAVTDMSNSTQHSGALQPDGRMLQEPQFDVEQVGQAVLYMSNLPLDTNVQFMTLMARDMPYVGRG